MDKQKFKLVIAYDGTGYEGWQVQKTGTGVQEKVETALAKLFPSRPRLHGSSRTDTGVHALGMIAHFEVPAAEFKMTTRKLALALNAWLPEDIRVLSAVRASKQFHARFNAAGKQYRYFVWNHTAMNPLIRQTTWQVPRPLDLLAMRAAAPLFVGRHDFKAFCSTGSSAKTTERQIFEARFGVASGMGFSGSDLVAFRVTGSGFLKQMVRSLVGTLVLIGRKRAKTELISELLEGKQRSNVGPTAPPHGLWLWDIA